MNPLCRSVKNYTEGLQRKHRAAQRKNSINYLFRVLKRHNLCFMYDNKKYQSHIFYTLPVRVEPVGVPAVLFHRHGEPAKQSGKNRKQTGEKQKQHVSSFLLPGKACFPYFVASPFEKMTLHAYFVASPFGEMALHVYFVISPFGEEALHTYFVVSPFGEEALHVFRCFPIWGNGFACVFRHFPIRGNGFARIFRCFPIWGNGFACVFRHFLIRGRGFARVFRHFPLRRTRSNVGWIGVEQNSKTRLSRLQNVSQPLKPPNC